MLQQSNTTQLDNALQTCSTLCSRSQHSPHNHTILSNPQRLRTPTILGLCCLLWCTIIQDQRGINIACFQLWGTIMKDHRRSNVKDRGFKVNIVQEEPLTTRGQRGEKFRSWVYKNHRMQKDLWKTVSKIHEVARGKGPLSWNWGVPHGKIVHNNDELIHKVHEIGRIRW